LAAHPLRQLDEAGVLVTVNSDDPPLFDTTLTDEYRRLGDAFGYGLDDVERLALNAVRAAFLPEADKARLLTEFAAEYAALRRCLGLPGKTDGPDRPSSPDGTAMETAAPHRR
jgi:adenosine deaminase